MVHPTHCKLIAASSNRLDAGSKRERLAVFSSSDDRGMLSRQRSTQPLPATPMSIGYCGRSRRFSSLLSVLNNHSNSIKSHGSLLPVSSQCR